MCPAFASNVAKSDSDNSEVSKFTNGPFYQQLVHDVSLRLGLNITLTPEEIDSIFNACRYEQVWVLNYTSAWCSVSPFHKYY